MLPLTPVNSSNIVQRQANINGDKIIVFSKFG